MTIERLKKWKEFAEYKLDIEGDLLMYGDELANYANLLIDEIERQTPCATCSDGELTFNKQRSDDDWDRFVPCRFCPVCGRKL